MKYAEFAKGAMFLKVTRAPPTILFPSRPLLLVFYGFFTKKKLTSAIIVILTELTLTGSEPALFDAESLDTAGGGDGEGDAALEVLATVTVAGNDLACASSADTETAAATSSANRNVFLTRSPIVLAVLVLSGYGCGARWRLDGLWRGRSRADGEQNAKQERPAGMWCERLRMW